MLNHSIPIRRSSNETENKQDKNRSNYSFVSSSKRSSSIRKVHPNVILDTESDEVRTLTRQVADSLAPNKSSNDSNNIEQELLDALRGHQVVSKTDRRAEKKLEKSQENIETPKKQFDKTKKRTRTPPPPSSSSSQTTANIDVEKTTEAFS